MSKSTSARFAEVLLCWRKNAIQKFPCSGPVMKSGAVTGDSIDGLFQQRLTHSCCIYGEIQFHHIFPGAIQESYLPPPMGACIFDAAGFLEIGFHKGIFHSCVQQSQLNVLHSKLCEMFPVEFRQSTGHDGIPTGAMDQQQCILAPKGDAMQVPAVFPVQRRTIGHRLDFQLSL